MRRFVYAFAVVAAAALVWWVMQPPAADDRAADDGAFQRGVGPGDGEPATREAQPDERPAHPDVPDAAAPAQAAFDTISPRPPVEPGRALRDVRDLVDKNQIGAARALAERYLAELPDGPESRQIMSLTGVHPHP